MPDAFEPIAPPFDFGGSQTREELIKKYVDTALAITGFSLEQLERHVDEPAGRRFGPLYKNLHSKFYGFVLIAQICKSNLGVILEPKDPIYGLPSIPAVYFGSDIAYKECSAKAGTIYINLGNALDLTVRDFAKLLNVSPHAIEIRRNGYDTQRGRKKYLMPSLERLLEDSKKLDYKVLFTLGRPSGKANGGDPPEAVKPA